ncbi:MAG: FMN-binding protein [Clostridia bacterium]|nr:FMN-binding protein [Clostridia bacterium]
MKKKSVLKRVGIILGGIVVLIAVLIGAVAINMKTAMDQQVNADIDMNQVKDGVYQGSSDCGLVYAEVEVTVKNHKIETINLLKHKNGNGKPAEAMLDVMIAENTDDVDAISGATASSKTIRNAVNHALQQGLN